MALLARAHTRSGVVHRRETEGNRVLMFQPKTTLQSHNWKRQFLYATCSVNAES